VINTQPLAITPDGDRKH